MGVVIPLIGGMEVPMVTPPDMLELVEVGIPTLDEPMALDIICEFLKKEKRIMQKWFTHLDKNRA
jgi:hypothetical protein